MTHFSKDFNPNPKKVAPSKAELEKLYSEPQHTARTLAKHYCVHQTTVSKWIKEYGIQPKKRTDLPMPKPPLDEAHWNWRGDEVSYSALHNYIRSRLGTPSKCEHCGITTAKKYEWANISKEYNRDLEDWVRLCTKCHRIFDNWKPNMPTNRDWHGRFIKNGV